MSHFGPPPRQLFVSATIARDLAGAGPTVTLSLTGNQRYDLRRFSDLAAAGLVASASSASLFRQENSEVSLYLFSPQAAISANDLRRLIPQSLLLMRAGAPPFADFQGDFVRLTLPPGTANTFKVDDLTSVGFNDRTTSAMLVSRWTGGAQEETVSVSNTFTNPWNDAFLGLIPLAQLLLGGGVAISKIQDPVFTWLPFPPATQSLPTNYAYVVVSQWFVFNAWGIGINVWLMLYLRLGRDGNSKVEVNVVDMDYYVWPGTGQGEMMNALSGAKNGIMSALQTASTLVFTNVTGTVCDDVYLLPGTQPNVKATETASAHGAGLSDVTIVLVNPR